MRKIRKIYETTQEFSFISPQKEFLLYLKSFQQSELGGIYQAIPWNELVKSLKIRKNRKGPDPTFSPQGMLALMFLKSYVGVNLKMLISSFTYDSW